jgi:hypothetical protein
MNGITLKSKVHFGRGRRNNKQLRTGEKPQPVPGRIPRVAKLMALAIRFEQFVRDGVVADYAELARLGHVTRARISQIMNLLNLAPDIQEALLFLPSVESGKDRVTERELRVIVRELNWQKQRKMWRAFDQSAAV